MNEEKSVLRDLNLDNDDELMLRPQTLNQYIGQDDIKEMLSIYIQAPCEEFRSFYFRMVGYTGSNY